MAAFKLKSQLSQADQDELDRTVAIATANRTTAEQSFYDARLPYVFNRVVNYDVVVGPTAQNPNPQTSTEYVSEAEGNVLPTGDSGFRQGAFFRKLNKDGANIFINVGTSSSATWHLLTAAATTDLSPSQSPSPSLSPSASASPSASPSASASASASASESASASASASPSGSASPSASKSLSPSASVSPSSSPSPSASKSQL